MFFFQSIAQFLLSEWLWSITYGWYHLPLNFFFMALILRFVARLHIITSVMFSFFATGISFVVFSLVVVGGLVGIFGVTYPLTAQPSAMIYASLYLSLIYSVLQVLLCIAIMPWYRMQVSVVILTALVSNSIAGLFTYWLLPLA